MKSVKKEIKQHSVPYQHRNVVHSIGLNLPYLKKNLSKVKLYSFIPEVGTLACKISCSVGR